MQLLALKMEAIIRGHNSEYMYEDQGPIALITIPVNRLDPDNMMTVLPLLCEVTVNRDSNILSDYTEIRILNRHSFAGYATRDWQEVCDNLDLDYWSHEWRIISGHWQAKFPWDLATNLDTIGYGEYK